MNPFFRLLSGRVERATKDSAAFDLFYNGASPLYVGDQPILIPTGVTSEFSPGYVAIMKERSGLGLKGLEVKAGVIDADYRGTWGVVARYPIHIEGFKRDDLGLPMLDRSGEPIIDLTPVKGWKPFKIMPGAKLAQFLLIETAKLEMINGGGHFNFLDDTRGEKGFGSSG